MNQEGQAARAWGKFYVSILPDFAMDWWEHSTPQKKGFNMVQHGSTGCCFPSSKGILAPFWSSQVQLEQEDLLADSLKKEIVRRVERDAMEAREEALLLGSGDGKGLRGSPTNYDGLWWTMGMWMIIWMVNDGYMDAGWFGMILDEHWMVWMTLDDELMDDFAWLLMITWLILDDEGWLGMILY